jgi:hypothetical protein
LGNSAKADSIAKLISHDARTKIIVGESPRVKPATSLITGSFVKRYIRRHSGIHKNPEALCFFRTGLRVKVHPCIKDKPPSGSVLGFLRTEPGKDNFNEGW